MPEMTAVPENKVRMLLFDYDAAPDGRGVYTKLRAEFPSQNDALNYRTRFLHDMYWGRIETLDGQLIEKLDEVYDFPRDEG